MDLPAYVKPDLWLDSDHAIEFTTRQGEAEPCGAILWHRNPVKGELSATPGWCAGGFQWRGPGIHWQLVTIDPLHVEPSILCGCGHHGFIRGGKWVPA